MNFVKNLILIITLMHTSFLSSSDDSKRQRINTNPTIAKFAGYASVFNVRDFNGHIILPGAFSRITSTASVSLLARPTKLLWQHDHSQPIGAITALREDDVGLYVEGCLLLSIQKGHEAYDLIKCGAINGLSVGFRIINGEHNAALDINYVIDAELYEISIVTMPANVHATIVSIY